MPDTDLRDRAVQPPKELDTSYTPEALRGSQSADGVWRPAAAPHVIQPGPRVVVDGGEAQVEILEDRTHRFAARVRAGGPAVIRPRIFAFAGWKARVDDVAVPIRAYPETGGIELEVQGGEHELS